jgi:hypothetical protein
VNEFRKSKFWGNVTVGRHIAVDLQPDADFNQNGGRPSHSVLPLSDVELATIIEPTKAGVQEPWSGARGAPGPRREPTLNTFGRAERMLVGQYGAAPKEIETRHGPGAAKYAH